MSCTSCGSESKFVCGGCGEAAYCCKEHQVKDWKSGHRKVCKAYVIKEDPKLGRFLVASRKIKAGSRILYKLRPAIVGLPVTKCAQVCLCGSQVGKNSNNCGHCKYQFCGKKCLEVHKMEEKFCKLLSKVKNKTLELIAPLRFLMLKQSDPEHFEKLLSLESHVEDLKASERWKALQKDIVEPLKGLDYNEEIISKVIGIISTNSFELIQPGKETPHHGLFELAALMNHDCVGNVRLVISVSAEEGFLLSVYAAIDIPKDAPILFNYGKPLDTTEQRQENLLKFKFFKCQCQRCQDPSELQTFNSAYICQSCQIGPVVKDKDKYTCQDCQAQMEKARAKKIDLDISNARGKLAKIQARVDLAQAKSMKDEFDRLIYPSHGFMLEILQALITCTAAAINNPGPEGEVQMQRQRIGWCEEILRSLDVLEPGLSIGRAMVLYEKQSSMVRLANLDFEKDPSQPKELLKVLLEGMSMLQEAKTSLDLEPASSPMTRYVQIVNEDIKELSDFIEMVRELA